MESKKWIIFIAAVIVLFGGLIVWVRVNNPPIDVTNVNENSIISASSDKGNISDHFRGQKDASIVIVEYGDFQCPSCASASSVVKKIVEDYEEDITFIYRNLPLAAHNHARAAAAAAESAGLQGKYWEMHDKLYQSHSDWQTASSDIRTKLFTSYAESLNLDKDKFIAGMTSEQVKSKISFDIALAKKVNATSTPSFFFNGEPVEASVNGNSEKLRDLIEESLKK